MKTRGFLFATVTILIWGVTFVNTRALLADFNSFEILFVRFAAAYAALWAIAPRRLKLSGFREEALFAAMGLTGVAAYQFLENCAISYTNASNVAILVSTCPMGTALLSALLLREKTLSRRFCLGFVLAMAGVCCVCAGGIRAFHFNPLGDLLAVCAMASWSVYSILITRANAGGYEPILAIRRTFFWALVLMVPFLPIGFDFTPATNAARFASGGNLFHLGFLGLLASALAFVLWNKTCKLLGTVTATCGLYLIPVVTAVVAALTLGETMTTLTAFGAVLTIGGVVISGLEPRTAQKAHAA